MIKPRIIVSPDYDKPRYFYIGYENNTGRKDHPLDKHVNCVLDAINDRGLSWEERRLAVIQSTDVDFSLSALKSFVRVRFVDDEQRPALDTFKRFVEPLAIKGKRPSEIKKRIIAEFGYEYSERAILTLCKNIKGAGGVGSKSSTERHVWGSDFYTGSLRTTAMCRPWSDLSAVSERS